MQYFNDAVEHLSLALQIVEDFVNSDQTVSAAKDRRKYVCRNLLIDTLATRAEIEMFKEQFQDSIADYMRVIELCKTYKEGNERSLASAFYCIGMANSLMARVTEAKEAYEKAQSIYRDLLITKLRQQGKDVSDDITYERLVEPSIFDNEDVKELKRLYKDMHINA